MNYNDIVKCLSMLDRHLLHMGNKVNELIKMIEHDIKLKEVDK